MHLSFGHPLTHCPLTSGIGSAQSPNHPGIGQTSRHPTLIDHPLTPIASAPIAPSRSWLPLSEVDHSVSDRFLGIRSLARGLTHSAKEKGAGAPCRITPG